MKNLLIAGALSAALLASGCATTPGTGTASTLTSAQFIADAQAAAAAICAVAPTAAAITSIIVAQNAGAVSSEAEATQAAQLFCSAIGSAKVSTKKLRVVAGRALLDFGTVVVNGRPVDLQGYAAR